MEVFTSDLQQLFQTLIAFCTFINELLIVDVKTLKRTISCTSTVFIDCVYSVGYLRNQKMIFCKNQINKTFSKLLQYQNSLGFFLRCLAQRYTQVSLLKSLHLLMIETRRKDLIKRQIAVIAIYKREKNAVKEQISFILIFSDVSVCVHSKHLRACYQRKSLTELQVAVILQQERCLKFT